MKATICILFLAMTLTACGPAMIPTPTASQTLATDSETPPCSPTLSLPDITPIIPTSTFSPRPIPVSTAAKTYFLDNLRMAYSVGGYLYVQNGDGMPRQLTDTRTDSNPIFSDDGEKIVFYRGEIPDKKSIFSINADGKSLREIITKDWLTKFGAGTKAGYLEFVPKTHKILFSTYLCPKYDPSSNSGCTLGLFLADTDTGKIKTLMDPFLTGRLLLGGNSRWLGNFSISPDGNLLSVTHEGQIDILDMDGKVVRHSIMEYPPDMPIEFFPRLYWFPDLSGLIAAVPTETDSCGSWYSNYTLTIWRYTFDGDLAYNIPLDPPVYWHIDLASISPNREWIVYFANEHELYKGNLLNGDTELLVQSNSILLMRNLPMLWSPDSKHFTSSADMPGLSILGSVNAPLGYAPGYFIGWIDATRFIYFPASARGQENTRILVGEIDGETVLSYKSNVVLSKFGTIPGDFVFTFTDSR